MIELRWVWSRLNANYWFYPALFAVGAAALAFAMIWLDRSGFAQGLNRVEWIMPARPSGASDILTVIAGSMIGVASTVFSITIAAVAYASGNYGPRLLTNFMEDRGNQFSLATFIGTFVYAVVVLRSVRAEGEAAAGAIDAPATTLPGFVPQLSLLVGFALMALSVAVLVYFLNHIPASIRINSVLQGIGERLLNDVRRDFPESADGGEDQTAPQGGAIRAEATGYIQLIDYDAMAKVAGNADCRIALEVRTGDFVHPGMALGRVCGDEADEELATQVRDAFTIGASRTPSQDPQFLIDELVEIGLRALSPGINDPFTAITALHWLGAATRRTGPARSSQEHRWGDGRGAPHPAPARRFRPLPRARLRRSPQRGGDQPAGGAGDARCAAPRRLHPRRRAPAGAAAAGGCPAAGTGAPQPAGAGHPGGGGAPRPVRSGIPAGRLIPKA